VVLFFKFAQVKKVKMADQATYLFSTRTSATLAEKIAAHYGQELGKLIFNNSVMENSNRF
jgi:hypothetical protein